MKEITYFASLTLISLMLMVSCKKDVNDPIFKPDSNMAVAPTVVTLNVTYNTATIEVTLPNGYDPKDLVQRGFEISTTENFSTSPMLPAVTGGIWNSNIWNFTEILNDTVNTRDTSNFLASLTGLTSETTYYVRAFARTSGAATTYGQTVNFTTPVNLELFNSGSLVNITSANFNALGFTMIDKDGDGHGFSLDADFGALVGADNGIVTSWSFNYLGDQDDLDPYNYLCLPAVELPNVACSIVAAVTPLATVFGESGAGWNAENVKFVISLDPITIDNADDAEVIHTRTLVPGSGNNVMNVAIPGNYLGKTVYIALVHYDSEGLYGIYVNYIHVLRDGN